MMKRVRVKRRIHLLKKLRSHSGCLLCGHVRTRVLLSPRELLCSTHSRAELFPLTPLRLIALLQLSTVFVFSASDNWRSIGAPSKDVVKNPTLASPAVTATTVAAEVPPAEAHSSVPAAEAQVKRKKTLITSNIIIKLFKRTPARCLPPLL